MPNDIPAIARSLQTFKERLREMLRGQRSGVFCIGPPGLGKDHAVDEVAEEFGIRPIQISPTSTAAAMGKFRDLKNAPLIKHSDADWWCYDLESLNVTKALMEPSPRLVLYQNRDAERLGIDRVLMRAPIALTSNFYPDDAPKRYQIHIDAVLDRLGLGRIILPRDPMERLRYVGWMVQQGYLRRIVYGGNREQSEDVLRWYYEHAWHLRQISLRELRDIAKARRDRPDRWQDDAAEMLRKDGGTWSTGPVPPCPVLPGGNRRAPHRQPAAEQKAAEPKEPDPAPQPVDLRPIDDGDYLEYLWRRWDLDEDEFFAFLRHRGVLDDQDCPTERAGEHIRKDGDTLLFDRDWVRALIEAVVQAEQQPDPREREVLQSTISQINGGMPLAAQEFFDSQAASFRKATDADALRFRAFIGLCQAGLFVDRDLPPEVRHLLKIRKAEFWLEHREATLKQLLSLGRQAVADKVQQKAEREQSAVHWTRRELSHEEIAEQEAQYELPPSPTIRKWGDDRDFRDFRCWVAAQVANDPVLLEQVRQVTDSDWWWRRKSRPLAQTLAALAKLAKLSEQQGAHS